MKRFFYLSLVVCVFISLLVTGCNCDIAVTVTTGPDISPASGVLRLYGIDPYTLDPALASEMTSHSYIMQLYSGLLRFEKELQPVGDIAERWEISSDRTTYTFFLREDVVFHNGKKVTAYDVQYSWERACDPKTGSPVAQTYLGDIVGVNEKLAGQADTISGVKVLNDYTLEVTIDSPRNYFLAKLTYPTTYVVDEDSVKKGSTWWKNPNGTGPFKLKSWDYGNTLILERNEHYYGRVASLERVEYGMWSGVPMVMYETGDIDIADVSVAYIDRIMDPAGPFAGQMQVAPELSFSYIGFNAAAEPFDDVHVRRAFTMALDKQRIIDVTYRNMVENAGGILPPGLPGYNENVVPLEFDPAAAREELALSRYGSAENLPDITITTSGYGGNISSHLEAAVTMWREYLGIEVTVRVLDPQFYLYNLKKEKDQMYDLAWIADYPHPQNFLDVLFRSGNENNFGEYSNPEVDALLDEAAVLPLWFGQSYTLVKPYVRGYELNVMGLPMLNKVEIVK